MRILYITGISLLVCSTTFAGIDLSLQDYHVKQIDRDTRVLYKKGLNWGPSYTDTQGNRTSPMNEGWSIIDTDLSEVEKVLETKLMNHIISMSDKYKEVVVIDWGCGMGQAIDTLADQSRRLGLNVRFIGYSNLSFPQWKHTSGVDFIFDDMYNLTKYLDKGSVGLIFSHFGMYHLKSEAIVEHIKLLAPYMLPGGMIISNTTEYKSNQFVDVSPYFRIEEYFTEFDKVFRFVRNGVGGTVVASVVPVN